MSISRRHFLAGGLLGMGALGIRALASGIPTGVLRNPLAPSAAWAGETPATTAKTLILVSSAAGDPVNNNVPGTYGVDDSVGAPIEHPADSAMAPTEYDFGGATHTAARPWTELPQSLRDRMAFFHHRTLTNSHPNHPKAMRLQGMVKGNEMLISALSKLTHTTLGSTQMEPISLGAKGAELVSFEGRVLANVSPDGLKTALTPGGNAALQAIRDDTLDQLNSLYRREGLTRHTEMLDALARTREEAKNVEVGLLSQLDAIGSHPDPRPKELDQIVAVCVLAAMNLAPAFTINLDFGGDNHADPGLAEEARNSATAIARLGTLWETIDTFKADGLLQQDIVVATFNVFGRTFGRKGGGTQTAGRDHNQNHHCMVLMGDSVRPGVVGGIEPAGRDWGAAAINPTTGAPVPDGAVGANDVSADNTFAAAAKTLGCALGIERASLDEIITRAEPVPTILA